MTVDFFSEFKNPLSIAGCIERLLDDRVGRLWKERTMSIVGDLHGANVAQEYAKVFHQVSAEPELARNKISRGRWSYGF